MSPAQAEAFPEAQLDPDDTPDERYTLRTTDALCRLISRVQEWDLDVAACAESHLAPVWYGKAENGLALPWFGRVWCNPPFSELRPWVEKAHAEMDRPEGPSVVAMLLPANRCEQPFWQDLVEQVRDRDDLLERSVLTSHFLPCRQSFGLPGNPERLGVKSSPQFGCVLLVWRRKP